MASFEKITSNTGKVSYRAKVRMKGFPVQSGTFPKMGEARKWASKVETEMRGRRYKVETQGENRTVDELIQSYIDTVLEAKSSKARFIANQRMQLLWWKERLGDYSLAHITPALISACRDELLTGRGKKRRSPATVNRYLSALSHALTTAMKEWEWIDQNPMAKVRKLKETRGRVRFLSEQERELLLNACQREKRKPLYLIVVLAIATGARKMEMLGLKWKDVDLARGYITVHETKNGEIRSLFLTGLALQLMKEHAKQRQRNGLVFPSRNKKPISIDCEWQQAVSKAGVTDFRFHDLRHTAASYLAMNGASIAEIAEVLGHKTLNMVKRYAHLSKAHTASVVASMTEKVFGQMEAQA